MNHVRMADTAADMLRDALADAQAAETRNRTKANHHRMQATIHEELADIAASDAADLSARLAEMGDR